MDQELILSRLSREDDDDRIAPLLVDGIQDERERLALPWSQVVSPTPCVCIGSDH